MTHIRMLLLQEAHNAMVSIVPFFAEAFRFNQAVVCVRPAQRQVLYPTPTRCDDLCIKRVLSAAIDVDTFEVAVIWRHRLSLGTYLAMRELPKRWISAQVCCGGPAVVTVAKVKTRRASTAFVFDIVPTFGGSYTLAVSD
jgi:hypothetical protein